MSKIEKTKIIGRFANVKLKGDHNKNKSALELKG